MPLSAWVADVTVAGNGWQSNRDMLWLKALVGGEGGCRKQNSINTDLKDQHCFFRVDPMTFWPLRQHSSTCPLQWIHVYHIYLLTVSVRYLHLNSGGTAALSVAGSFSVRAQQHLQGRFLIAWQRQSGDVLTTLYTSKHPFNHNQTPVSTSRTNKALADCLRFSRSRLQEVEFMQETLIKNVVDDFYVKEIVIPQTIRYQPKLCKGNKRCWCSWGFKACANSSPQWKVFVMTHNQFLNGNAKRVWV